MVGALLCLLTAAHFPIRQQPNPMLSALMLTKAAHLAVADLAEIAVGTRTDTCRAIARSEARPAMCSRICAASQKKKIINEKKKRREPVNPYMEEEKQRARVWPEVVNKNSHGMPMQTFFARHC
jgi:hypothetical protein